MKNLAYGEVHFLVDDEAADAIVEYAVLMAKTGSADSVTLFVLGPDGNHEQTKFAIGPATMISAETTRSELEQPDNSEALAYMREKMAQLDWMPGDTF